MYNLVYNISSSKVLSYCKTLDATFDFEVSKSQLYSSFAMVLFSLRAHIQSDRVTL